MAIQTKQMALLAHARESATFDSNKLANVIYDNAEIVNSRRAAFQRVEAALGLTDNMKLPHLYKGLDRDQIYMEGVRRAREIVSDMIAHGHEHFKSFTERYHLTNSSPFGMNFLMFRKTIELQATEEQKLYWLPLIDQMKINGAYVQTELGHGTFVRGIETTATYDEISGEFIVDSPTLTATKYWPGGLGISCTHAVVAARLLTKGQDHGMHWFVVKVRSLEDYAPIQGVELGDIGMKMAYNGTCNGYARFNQLRIPRDSLLGAYAEVLPDGTYQLRQSSATDLSKLLYGTMLDGRCIIIKCAGFGLAQALTITTRYSVVREQGIPMFAHADTPEVPLIAFQSQNYRLLTLISQAYAILFASKAFDNVYYPYFSKWGTGRLNQLSYIHSLSTGLKAWATTVASAGADEARRMCGGHGYVALSGLPDVVATVSGTATFEGDNYVMWQQLVRYLFKQIQAFTSTNPVDPELREYMEDLKLYLSENAPELTPDADRLYDSSVLLSLFRHRSCRLLAMAYRLVTRDSKESSLAEAWNKHMMVILAAGHAYAEYFILRSFQISVREVEATEPSLCLPLSRLCNLFALTTIVSPVSSFYAVSFTEDGVLSSNQLMSMRAKINEILEALLPDIVALTDAWDFTDASLCSALGCKDGNVYERLMSWTRQLPVNNGDVVGKFWEGKEGIGAFLKKQKQRHRSLL
ncbi:acyl-CoA dehydrogenase/oxidase C-terminal [Aspergillus ambiguus]|uniref:acyl-CoA dehydrogenase/oxidase C-terminal n=1 Tax=Aspergillus ambiguus TaxID=176160 RepID=UPI003CCD4DCC